MKQPSNTPWWQPSDQVKQIRVIQSKSNSNFFILAVVIALIAGGIGATIGRSSITNVGANLVETKNKIERAPDSIAALAARVIPAVVSISVKGATSSDTGSGFFLDSNGYVLTNNHVVAAAATSGTITETYTFPTPEVSIENEQLYVRLYAGNRVGPGNTLSPNADEFTVAPYIASYTFIAPCPNPTNLSISACTSTSITMNYVGKDGLFVFIYNYIIYKTVSGVTTQVTTGTNTGQGNANTVSQTDTVEASLKVEYDIYHLKKNNRIAAIFKRDKPI
jgi:hypothetical protein